MTTKFMFDTPNGVVFVAEETLERALMDVADQLGIHLVSAVAIQSLPKTSVPFLRLVSHQ